MGLLRFLGLAVLTNLRLSVIFKLSFAINVIVAVIKQALFLVAWNFFFVKYRNINGWDFSDLLFIYGLLSVGIGIVEIFFYGLRELPEMVNANLLGSYLIQPQNIILNIALSRGQISSVGDLATGVIAIIYSNYCTIHLSKVLLLLPLSVIFIFSLYLYLGSISFFIKNSTELIREIYRSMMIIVTQPNAAYKGLLKVLTLTILPISFLTFFPVEFVKGSDYRYLLISYLGTLIFLALACSLFYRGIRRYESGNIFNHKY